MVHNPLPVTLAAIGLAWTAFSERNSHVGAATTRLDDGQDKTAGTAKARGRAWAGAFGQSAAERTRQSAAQTGEFAREYPIIMVGTGLVLGAALAALLPATQFENEKLGPARDRALREARKAADAGARGAKQGAKEESASSETGETRQRQPKSGGAGSGDNSSHSWTP